MRYTRQQAIKEFKETYMPVIRQIEKTNGNGKDSIMRREEWNNFTDFLCKEGLITSKQYEEWETPKICED